jgi:ABC-2 type transport system permease protein
MRRTWIFFKLRMLQLKSDKTALFFCYVLPVLLLLCIGYPLQMRGEPKIAVSYTTQEQSASTQALLNHLQQLPLLRVQPYQDAKTPVRVALEGNTIQHYLEIRAAGYVLHSNSLPENRIENAALQGILEGYLGSRVHAGFATETVASKKTTSYVMTLLPGLIGMTLLIAGLGGFGAVLIAEQHQGLYKNIKTIDVSPIPFLAGLFASRLLVSYSVAIALFALSVVVFGISVDVNYLLLGLVITLGCVAFLSLGLMLSTISPSVSAFSGIVNAVQMPLLVLGGVFFSVSTFPSWLQTIANLLPLTQLNTAMRSILFDSVGFENMSQLYPQIATLAVWCVVTLVVARFKFKW